MIKKFGTLSYLEQEDYLNSLGAYNKVIRKIILTNDKKQGNLRFRIDYKKLIEIQESLDFTQFYRVWNNPEHLTIQETKDSPYVFINAVPRPLVSWGNIARKIIRYTGIRLKNEEPKSQHLPTPIYYVPSLGINNYVVIDIRAAYWSILKGITIDNKKTFLPQYDDLTKNKTLRNIVWSCFETKEFKYLEHGIEQTSENMFHNPRIVYELYEYLQAIALDMMNLFPIYQWSADSCIAPLMYKEQIQQALATRWHLGSHVEAEGMGRIQGLGQYHIGNKDTLNRIKEDDINLQPISNLSLDLNIRELQNRRGEMLQLEKTYRRVNEKRFVHNLSRAIPN